MTTGSLNHADFQTVFSPENKARTIAALRHKTVCSKVFQSFIKAALTRRRAAAVLIPLCVNLQGDPCLLFTLRSLKLAKHRGEISFPGGAADPEDTSAMDTALRETEEELGIGRNRIDIWCTLEKVPTVSTVMAVSPVLGFIKEPLDAGTLQVNPAEVEKAFTVPLSHFCDKRNWDHSQVFPALTAPVYKNLEVSHPLGEHSTSTIIRSPYDEDDANSDSASSTSPLQDVRLWGLTAILTHFVLQSLLPHVYKDHLPNLWS